MVIKISNARQVDRIQQPFQTSLYLPGSKSITLRDYVLAALAKGTSHIHYPGICDDTFRMEDSLQRLGIDVISKETSKSIKGQGGVFAAGEIHLHLGLSAASTRLLLALSILRQDQTILDGLPSLRARPNKYLVDALTDLGATIQSSNDGYLPISVIGPEKFAPSVSMRGDQSSQYFSALLIIAPLLPQGLHIDVEGELVSKPYIDITMNEMKKFGVDVENNDYQHFFIAPQPYQPTSLTVEGDASAASYFAAMATLHGGTITLQNLGTSTLQGDFQFLKLCERLGAQIDYQAQTTTITGPPGGILTPLNETIDMESMPDVAPTLMMIAPFLPGTTKITGLATLRIKECDRIAVPAKHLRLLGVEVTEGEDYITIGEFHPDPLTKEIAIETHDDHRIAMSFAVLGSKIGSMTILDPQCVNKTYPRFWNDFESLYSPSNRPN